MNLISGMLCKSPTLFYRELQPYFGRRTLYQGMSRLPCDTNILPRILYLYVYSMMITLNIYYIHIRFLMSNSTTPRKDVDESLLRWARENLKNIPSDDNYEKMISGMPYNTMNGTYISRGFWVAAKIREYTNMEIDDYSNPLSIRAACERRIGILKEIFGKTGEILWLAPPFTVDYGFNVCVGEKFYANFNVCFLDTAPIIIGDEVTVGPNTTFVTATHPIEPEERSKNISFALPIRIGNKVWIGANVVILPGVTIGDGSTIAAGAIVRADVPPRVVVGGVPAKILKRLPSSG